MSHTPKVSVSASEPDEPVAWDQHLRWLAPLSVGVLIVATGFIWWQSQQQDQRVQVFQAYVDASSPAEPLSAREQADRLSAVAQAYPDEPEAPMALIQAGALLFNEGDYAGALDQYTAFLEAYPSHALKDNPAWGALHAREALGELDAALEGYQAYAADDLLYPQARLAVARVYEKQGDWSGARAEYERILEEMPDAPWSGQAEIFLQHVRLREEADAEAVPDAADTKPAETEPAQTEIEEAEIEEAE